MLFFRYGDRFYTSESDVYRRQILTCKDDPRTEMVKTTAHESVRQYYLPNVNKTRDTPHWPYMSTRHLLAIIST